MIPEAAARKAIDLAGRGKNVSEIARELGHDRKTIRTYLGGHRAPGQPRARADAFTPFDGYARQRAGDDPHLRRTGLHGELAGLGYAGSYPAFNREIRSRGIIIGCGICRPRSSHRQRPGRHPEQLPASIVPVTGETIASYLARLAAAAHIQVRDITSCLPPWFATRTAACDDLNGNSSRGPGDPAYLAALTGISENALRRALPALDLAYGDPRPAVRATRSCLRCAARHGQDEPVPVHYPAHRRTCPRHRTWIGRDTQIDITATPAITAAGRKASRLASEHGITRFVLAETIARQGTIGAPDARRRAMTLAQASPHIDPGHPDTTEAAAYPETVKAAVVLLRAQGALPGGPE